MDSIFLHTPKAILLMGPTASGKTDFAITLSQHLPVDIISVDSALIYRDMDIGTSKPSSEKLRLAPHRLINIRDPSETYSVGNFYCDVLKEIKKITQINRIPLLVGGSMLYFKAFLEGLSPLPPTDLEIRNYIIRKVKRVGWEILHQKLKKIDPVSADRIHPNDQQRLLRALEVFFVSGHTLTDLTKRYNKNPISEYKVHQFAIMPPSRELLYQRITKRFHQMLASGFEDEVRALFIRSDLHREMPSLRCVGYRQMYTYLAGETNYDDMVFSGIRATRHLAKHQITWLRKWNGLYWLDSDQPVAALNKVMKIISA